MRVLQGDNRSTTWYGPYRSKSLLVEWEKTLFSKMMLAEVIIIMGLMVVCGGILTWIATVIGTRL